jgi:hypothetical protein
MSDPSPPAQERADLIPPRAYLGWGLVTTVLCFLPLGLVALYYGFRTNRAMLEGREEDARRASATTRRWLIATIVIGLLTWLLLALAVLLLGAFSS